MNIQYFVIRVISWFVLKLPLFFSNRIVFTAKSVIEDDAQKKRFMLECECIKTYSFLDPRLSWKLKAISSVCTISADQVNKLHAWRGKTSPIYFGTANKSSINDESILNVGHFTTNKKNSFDAVFLGVKSELVKCCSVSLIGCSNGTYYLSMYWYLSDEATLLVKDVDISKLENNKVKYLTCNPFSNLYGVCSWEDKVSQANKIIVENFDVINTELSFLEKKLMNILNIGRHAVTVRSLDVLVKDNEPYFLSEELYRSMCNSMEFSKAELDFRVDECLIGRAPLHDVFLAYKKIEEKEFLVKVIPRIDSFPFKQTFIKSENLTQDEQADASYLTYESSSCHVSNSHNVLAIYYLAENKFKKMSDSYSDCILNGDVNPEKNYDLLYKAFIEVDSIEQQIKNSIGRTSSIAYICARNDYVLRLSILCRSLLDRVKEVKDDVERRKNNANELVQYENLKYQRKNSILVVMLAIVQILLAYISWKYTFSS
ncbi:hypothetical protein ACET8Y_12880 [Aeromonas veronii]